MFVLGNFLSAIAAILDTLVTILYWLIIIRAITSWVNPDPYNVIVIFLHRVTEPLIAPFRRLVPFHPVGVDLSPLFAILFLIFVQLFFVQSLKDWAHRLG